MLLYGKCATSYFNFQGDDLDFWLSGNDAAAAKQTEPSVTANGPAESPSAISVPSVKVSPADVVLTSEEEDHSPRDGEEVRTLLSPLF